MVSKESAQFQEPHNTEELYLRLHALHINHKFEINLYYLVSFFYKYYKNVWDDR